MILGLSGYARSGKDTAAEGLELFGFTRVSFADKLREFILLLNPIVDVEYGVSRVRVRDVIEEHGWDGYKSSKHGNEVRELLQRLGTECGRELIDDDIWVNPVINLYKNNEVARLVIPDVRFPNEAKAIKKAGGYVVRIHRPGVLPANGHKSEVALDDWPFDAVLDNDSTVDELRRRVANLALAFVL